MMQNLNDMIRVSCISALYPSWLPKVASQLYNECISGFYHHVSTSCLLFQTTGWCRLHIQTKVKIVFYLQLY